MIKLKGGERMKKWVFILFVISFDLQAKEVSFTQEDRERLIRLEATMKEFKDSVDKRFEQMDKRFEEFRDYVDKRFEQIDKRFEQMISFLWILSGIFVGILAVTIGFAFWDRRTIIRRAKSEAVEEIERSGKLKDLLNAFRELGKKNPEVAEILEKFGLL
jgi:hypothetical protein